MKINVRTKKEILKNVAFLAFAALLWLSAWLLYILTAWVLGLVFPDNLLGIFKVAGKTLIIGLIVYWLFVNSWLNVKFK